MTRPHAQANMGGPTELSPFLTCLADAARRHGYTDAAAADMVQWCGRYILFRGKQHPQEMGRVEIGAARAALEFLYGTYLQRQF